MEVVEESIRLLITKSKDINRKTKQGLDFFFIADCQLEPDIEISDITNTPSCLQKRQKCGWTLRFKLVTIKRSIQSKCDNKTEKKMLKCHSYIMENPQ